MTQDQLRAKAERASVSLAATSPRRDPYALTIWQCCDTPFDKFRFVGNGPFFEFTVWDYDRGGGVTVADALNYFSRIGATVVRHERRSEPFDEDGSDMWHDYFLVEWHDKSWAEYSRVARGLQPAE